MMRYHLPTHILLSLHSLFCLKSWVGKDVSLDGFNHSMSFVNSLSFFKVNLKVNVYSCN